MAPVFLRTILLLALPLATGLVGAQPVVVAVKKTGETVVVDVTARVAASIGPAWDALTDYDHMAEYVSAVRESRILSRKGNTLEVAQTGGARHGFIDFSFSTVRAVELVPETEIRSHLVRGDFKSYEFTTRLSSIDTASGELTITHHGVYVPHVWVPPIVGPALIERETRQQYTDLIAEILRRQADPRRGATPPRAASSP